MLLQASSLSSCLLSYSSRNCRNIFPEVVHFRPLRGKAKTFSSSTTFFCVSVGINEIAEITHNKVLIAAAVSAAIGQLSKPFTSAILYGNRNGLDFKAAFQAGGFPSTHSSASVAAAMILGLERGFSDPVFGLAVVYAGLIMYDAQGVRREVGIHAKTLNRILLRSSVPSNGADDLINSQPRKTEPNPESLEALFLEEANPFSPKQAKSEVVSRSENKKGQIDKPMSSSLVSDVQGGSGKVSSGQVLLKESIGHTEIEVLAGALLGFFVSLAVFNIT